MISKIDTSSIVLRTHPIKVCMLDELSAMEKIIEEVLIDLMAEKVMSARECKPLRQPLVDPGHPESSQKREPSI
jgi:hypothetical protein